MKWTAPFKQLLGIGLILCSGLAVSQTEELRLARFPKSANQYVAAQIIGDVYRNAGLAVTIIPMPPTRSPIEALAGHIDGEVSRLKSHVENNPGLILVTPSFDYFTMCAFSKMRITIQSVADLKKYRVGIIRGVQAAMDLTKGLDNVETAVNSESLLLMLEAGRFDVAIDVDVNGEFQIQKHALHGIRSIGELQRAEVFHILAPAKAQLQDRISTTIARMKKSGELANLKRKYNRAFVEQGVEPD